MPPPTGFSWIEKPRLAAMARPGSVDELHWLRKQGIEVLLSLTEDPPWRHWINEAGLLLVHEPVVDMEAPSQEQLDRCISAIERAHAHDMGVAVHCGAGMGRTGVVLAVFLIFSGMEAREAIAKVREMRPGSIETDEQFDAVLAYGRRRVKS